MRAAEILRYMESSFIKKLISAIVKATKAKNNERSVSNQTLGLCNKTER